MRNRKSVTALILLAAGVGLLAGCSGSASSDAGGSAVAAAGAGAANAPVPRSQPAGPASGSSGRTGVTARIAAGSAIVYTSQLTVRVTKVTDAATEARQIVETVGGYVANGTTSSVTGADAGLEVKIPVAVYPATLSRLAALGTQLSLQQQAQDVTEQVADVNSQVTSDQDAIVQLRALLSHAGSVGDLLTVQNQINSEESDLESIQAQQRALSAQTSYATVTMTIVGPKAKPAVVKHRKPAHPPSLAGGLAAGWRALRITVDWTLAFLGAVGPFAAIAALVAFAAYRTRRWALSRRTA